MDEKIKGLWPAVKAFFSKLNKKTRRMIVVIVLLSAAAITGLAVFGAAKPYAVLFTGLSTEDMSSIITYLDSSGATDYQAQGSDTILVPQEQEALLKAKILEQGYPSSGFGYSLYLDNVSSLSTESDRQRMYLFDLQDRLGAVVRCFDGVKDAKVTIAEGSQNSFVLDRDNVMEASASVIVTMNGSRQLSSQQASAIRSLISSAVQGLVIDNISISDTAGNRYSSQEEAGSTALAQLKFELEARVNTAVRANIIQVLMPLFGADNISVSVNSTVDVSRSYLDSTTYEQPDWAADGSTGGEGIIGSKVYENSILRNGQQDGTGGVVGTESNSGITGYVGEYQPDGSEDAITSSGEVEYRVDTHHSQRDTPAGVISDVMVSISINSAVAQTADIGLLISHVARAAGISAQVQADKISILTMPFYQQQSNAPTDMEPAAEIPQWMLYAAAAGALLFLLLLLVILGIYKKRKKRKKAGSIPVYTMPTPARSQRADIMELNSERSMELRKEVRQFAEGNPEIAAQMVKNWLRGGDSSRG